MDTLSSKDTHRRQISFQDRQTAVRRDGVLLASDDIIGLGRCFFQNLRQCLAGYVQALGVDLMLHLLEDGRHAAQIMQRIHSIFAAGLDIDDTGCDSVEPFKIIQGQFDTQLVGKGDQMHGSVGASADGQIHADCIFQCLFGDDIGGLQILKYHLYDLSLIHIYRKTALFVIISDTDDTFNFVVSILYTQLFNLLCDKADDVYGGRLPVHVRCLLDEFANIGQIPKFEKLIATIRSREISASIIFGLDGPLGEHICLAFQLSVLVDDFQRTEQVIGRIVCIGQMCIRDSLSFIRFFSQEICSFDNRQGRFSKRFIVICSACFSGGKEAQDLQI